MASARTPEGLNRNCPHTSLDQITVSHGGAQYSWRVKCPQDLLRGTVLSIQTSWLQARTFREWAAHNRPSESLKVSKWGQGAHTHEICSDACSCIGSTTRDEASAKLSLLTWERPNTQNCVKPAVLYVAPPPRKKAATCKSMEFEFGCPCARSMQHAALWAQ